MSKHTQRRAGSALRTILAQATPQEREAVATVIRQVLQARQTAAADGVAIDDARLQETITALGSFAPVLHEHPNALLALETLVQRAQSKADVLSKDGRPSGTVGTPVSNGPGYAWLTFDNKNAPIGVQNARTLRGFADTVPWVRKAIDVLCGQFANSDIDVLPQDPSHKYDAKTQRALKRLLQQPNKLRQNWSELTYSVAEDHLVIARGVYEKVQNVGRTPTEIYALNGAGVKIYPQWDGNPDVPRYLFDDPDAPAGTPKRPLLNDEAIVLLAHPGTYRMGLSTVQILINEIQADLEAMRAMKRAVGLKPPAHLINIPGFSQTAINRFKEKYRSEFAGKEDLMVIGTDTDKLAQVFNLVTSAKDSQFLDLQIYLARKIGILFGVSPAKLGILFDANKSNTGTQQENDDDVGLMPLFYLFERYLNRELLADYAPKFPDGRDNLDALNLRIVYPNVSESARLKHIIGVAPFLAQALAGLPFVTLNMAMAIMGEEPLPHAGNTFWMMTKDGAYPIATFDQDYGDWNSGLGTNGPQVGAQDPAGGPSSDERDPQPVKPEPPPEPVVAPPSSAPPTSDSNGPAPDHIQPNDDTAKQFTELARMLGGADARPPGSPWRPGHQKAIRIPGTAVKGQSSGRGKVTAEARRALEARAQRIFADARNTKEHAK